jgi:tripartite-type tricarboxylate transporter receptor subunit TctC
MLKPRFDLVVAIVAIALAGSSAAAQSDYPRRPITLIVPFAAGGPTDVISRIVGEHMSRTLGQPIVYENTVGAPGLTASTRAMRANPDGYIIVMGHMGTHATAVSLVPNLGYNPVTDFSPIGPAAGTPVLIVAKRDFPPRDLKEFMTYVRVNVSTLKMAHAGVGSVSFTACLLLNQLMQVRPASLPYAGTGPAMTALTRGQVDYMCDQIVNVVPPLQNAAIKAYAVGTPERNPVLPQIPTAREAGLPEFDVSAWHGLFAPKDTPQPVLDKLTDALDRALDDEAVRGRLLARGADIPSKERRGQRALADLVKSEIARWAQVIKAAGPLN